MSSDFGERFTEARTAQGITLEEAAEATKIRAEYLSGIESGDCNFNLPEIYVRGFVKIYAKYLKLDVNEMVAGFPSNDSESSNAKSWKKTSYSAVIAGEKERDEAADCNSAGILKFPEKLKLLSGNIRRAVCGRRLMQVLFVIAIALALFFAFGKKIFHVPGKIPQSQVDKVFGEPVQSVISLAAIGNAKVVVREKASGDKIFAGNLEAGMVKKISYSRPIQIFYDKGESLWIKRSNGEQVYVQPGRGGIEVK
jgi:transcriptional regulator with XRE-family HTH domain